LRDITATLIDLARRGYLTIEQTPKDYIFTRQKPKGFKEGARLKAHEAEVLTGLFPTGDTTRLSDLENEFYAHIPVIRSALCDSLIAAQIWRSDPGKIRTAWWWIAFTAAVVAVFVLSLSGETPSIPLFLCILISAGIVAAFAPVMPRKTWHGARILEHILGLEEFLHRTDRDRIRREKEPGILFERMLPYAMALGVATQWAKAFEGIYQVSPTWYVDTGGASFSPTDFVGRVQTSTDRMGTVLTSAPRSSGGSGFSGGSSGGGGGGGGGGAW
jgi:uncharacterized membrane protein